jgi:hypothetical protein
MYVNCMFATLFGLDALVYILINNNDYTVCFSSSVIFSGALIVVHLQNATNTKERTGAMAGMYYSYIS